MSWFTIGWIAWFLMFAVIEGIAIFNDKKNDTLSEHIRLWLSTHEKLGRTIWIVISGIFFAWFIIHIAVAGSI